MKKDERTILTKEKIEADVMSVLAIDLVVGGIGRGYCAGDAV